MFNQISFVILCGVLFTFVLGCSSPEETISGSEETPTEPTEPVEPDIFVGSPLFLDFRSRWDTDKDEKDLPFKTYNGNCFIPPLTPPESGLGSSEKNCSITMPEAQMFYSETRFRIGSRVSSSCPIVKFRPYYYRRSLSASFGVPETGGVIDCRRSYVDSSMNTIYVPDSKECYGGAAPILVNDFPKNVGFYFLTVFADTSNFTLKASSNLRWYGGYKVNYMLTNNLPAVDRPDPVISGSNSRAGAEADWANFYDYSITCESHWGAELYRLNIVISDENTNGSGLDEYTDWH
ncbi:hypothetical protein D3C87_571840 [compost metagenome]